MSLDSSGEYNTQLGRRNMYTNLNVIAKAPGEEKQNIKSPFVHPYQGD